MAKTATAAPANGDDTIQPPPEMAVPPLDHPAWDGIKEWVQAEIAKGEKAVEAVAVDASGLPALAHPAWNGLKDWIRREIGYAQAGHSAEQRATELNP